MKELVKELIHKLVDNQDAVVVSEKIEGETIKYKIHVSPNDIGKIVGKKGQNITALRTILKAIGAKKEKKKVIIDLDEY